MKQFFVVFGGVFVAVAFFSLVLFMRRKKSSCRCGQGHCQTGTKCDSDTDK
ncbi:hypothetical protein [Seleniivibrio woodruffii]|uniref:Uncharacterized protein n=1 Tax=Seleniivibrio woodruffii TaxID=1078050 RepID=A0A4R1KEU0_9BACT|nr:hypothetical protein [Seleniivibrio woodruffii]TCK62667.1 hypothetical protein C8D98_1201 [Seleniivibrio woodruffii]TVZ36907.1 hypothetical protein OF66_2548 [Seleniivibrio woodruffii]